MTKDKELEIIEAYKRIELDPNAFDNENTNIIKELYSRIPNVATEPSSTAVDFSTPQTQVAKIINTAGRDLSIGPKPDEPDEGFWKGLKRTLERSSIQKSGEIVGTVSNILGTTSSRKAETRDLKDKTGKPIYSSAQLRGDIAPGSPMYSTIKEYIPEITKEEAKKKTEESPLFQYGNEIREVTKNYIESREDLKDPENMVELSWGTVLNPSVMGRAIGEGIPSILAIIGSGTVATVATGNPIVGTVTAMSMGGLLEGSGAYTTAKEYGKLDYEEQARVGMLVGTINGMISAIPGYTFLKGFGPTFQKELSRKIIEKGLFKPIAQDVLIQGISESVEEALQEGVSIIGEMSYMDEVDQPTKEQILNRIGASAYGGFLLGKGTGAVGHTGTVAKYPGSELQTTRKITKSVQKAEKEGGMEDNIAYQEVVRAEQEGEIDADTANYMKYFINQNPDFDGKTVVEITDKARFLVKNQMIKDRMDKGMSKEEATKDAEQFLKNEEVDESKELYSIAGATSGVEVDGIKKVLLNLYSGADKNTVVEEMYGTFYRYLTPEEKAVVEKEFLEKNPGASVDQNALQEWFEKRGTEYFFEAQPGLQKNAFEKALLKVKNLIKKVGRSANQVSPLKTKELFELKAVKGFKGEISEDTDETFEVRPVRPVPESQMDNMGLEPVKGGVYVDPITKKPYKTGASYNQGSINVSGKFPKFSIDDVETDPTTKESGPIVRTNLTRGKLYTWLTGDVPKDWQGQNPVENNPAKNNQGPVIAVHQGKDHFYTLESNYDVPLSLNTYPEKGNPTLRPTANGILEFGNVVGQIHYPGSTKLTQEEQAEVKKHLIEKTGNPNVSVPTTGKIHPVYDKITIKDRRDTDESFELKEVTDENQLNVAREERKTIQVKNVKLTDKERKLISESDLDVDKKEIANAIRSIKAKHPKKDGWADLIATDITINKSGNLEIEFEKQQYTFGLGKNGKIAQGKERKKLETKLGNRVVKEVLKVVDRAKNGDKNAQTILKQKTWYSSLKQGIREQYGGFLDIFAEALGVLSPKTPVDANYKSAEIFLEEFTKGSYDSMIEPFVEYIEQGGKPGKYDGPVPTKPNGAKFGTNSRQSLSVLASMWIELKPGMSPKARNFAGNILGTIDRATIDVWAGRFLQRVSGGKTIPPKAEMAVSGNVTASGEYGGNFGIGGGAFAHAVEKLRRMNIKELEGLDTPSLQAVVWFLEKEVWTKNNWTTKSGEGGSFESNLLREQLPKSKGGKTVPRDYSRTQVGMSRQQGKKEPSDKEIKELQNEIIKTTIGDANIKVVRAESSLGLYENQPEKSYDTELVTTKDYYPNKVIDKVIKYAKKDNQDAIFVSKVLKPGEDHPNSRPGLEVYFNKNLSEADTKPLIKMIMDNGFDGFTFIREQRTPENQYTGVRIQVVPEFTARYDSELSNQFKDEQFFEEWMDNKKFDLDDLFVELDKKYNSFDINRNNYITEVVFNEEYDNRRKRSKKNDREVWSRSSSYSQVQEATRESEKSQGKSGQNLDRDKKESYQLKPFYSPATKAVENPRFGKSKQVQGILPYLKNQQVKDDEIKWLGLREWLSDKKGKVSKEELLDFLNKNEVTVTETMMGDHSTFQAYNRLVKFTQWTLEGDKKDQRELVLTFNPKPKLTELPEGWRVEEEINYGIYDTEVVYYVRNGVRNGEFRGDTPEQAIETALQVLNEDNGSSYTVPSGHSYGDPKLDINRLAMVRFNTRYDTEGNKVLFIDEIQSDWHQTGEKEGYVKSKEIPEGWKVKSVEHNIYPNTETWYHMYKDGNEIGGIQVKDVGQGEKAILKELKEQAIKNIDYYGLPDAPYKGNEWLKFSLKRMLRYGAENGFDKVSWTTGEQQSQRYDLSKHIDRIEYVAPPFNEEGPVYSDRGFNLNRYSVKAYDLNGREVLNKFFTEKELEDNVGKTVAQRIVNREGKIFTDTKTPIYTLSGLNLVNDEKGMKVFYNQKIPNILKKYFRKNKWDSKVEVLELNMGEGKINVVDNDGDPIKGVDSFRNLEMFLTESPKAFKKIVGEGVKISIGDKANAYTILYNDDAGFVEIQSAIDKELHMTIYELDYNWDSFDEESFFDAYNESLEDAFNAIKRSAEKYIEDGTIKYTSKQLSARITPDMKESVMMGQESFQLKSVEEMPFEIGETYSELMGRKVVDKLNRLKKVQTIIGEVPEEMDAYLEAEMFIGRASEKLRVFEEYEDDLTKRIVDNYNMVDFGDYLYALHAPERNEKLRNEFPERWDEDSSPSGMSDIEAENIIKKYKGDKTIKKLAKEFKTNVIDKNLQALLDGEMITEEVYETLVNTYDNYVPLKGIDTQEIFGGTGKGFSTQGKDIKRAYGRESRAKNPYVNSLVDFRTSIIRVEKNKVGQALYNLVLENPNDNYWKASGLKYKPRYNQEGELEFMDPEKVGVHDFIVRVDGKIKKIVIKDPALLSGLKNLGAGVGIPVLQEINSYFRAVNTHLNPVFLLTNFTRDVQSAGIVLGGEHSKKIRNKVMKNIPSAMKGIWKSNRKKDPNEWSELYDNFKGVGGKMGWFDNLTLEQKVKQLERKIKLSGKSGVKQVKAVGQFIEDVNDVVESAVRLSTYKAMLDAGKTEKQSASVAKNLTVNFNKKGELGTLMNSFYLFSNAGIQGTARIFDALKHKRVKQTAFGLVVAGFLQSMFNRWMDDEEWDQIDNHVKDNNWMILLPNKKDVSFSLKMAYGWSSFKNMGSILEEMTFGDTDPVEGVTRIFKSIIDGFMPISGGSFEQLISPTATDPIVQISQNKAWHGGPIMPEQPQFSPKKPDAELYFKSARQVSIATAKAMRKATKDAPLPLEILKLEKGPIDVSPETLDHIIDTFTGGTGKFIANTLESGRSIYGITKGKSPEIKNIPFVNTLVKTKSEYKAKNIVYNMLNESARKVYSKEDKAKFLKYLRFMIKDKHITRSKAKEHKEKLIKNQKKARESFK